MHDSHDPFVGVDFRKKFLELLAIAVGGKEPLELTIRYFEGGEDFGAGSMRKLAGLFGIPTTTARRYIQKVTDVCEQAGILPQKWAAKVAFNRRTFNRTTPSRTKR